MLRRKRMFLVLISIVFIGGGFIMVIRNKSRSLEIKPFDINDYQYYIDNCPTNKNLGSIYDAEDAIAKAETIWIEMYGKRIKQEKPYQVFYDEKEKVWLIHGSLRSNMMGGVSNILIENDTGKVLAIWHEK